MKHITALSLLNDIVGDGYLSETNAARAQEMLSAAASEDKKAPAGAWRDDLVGLRHIEGAGWRPAARDHPDAVYVAADVHRVLEPLLRGPVRTN